MPEGARELRLVLTVTDYEAALRLYRDALGLREEASFVDDNGGRATLLFSGRATIEIGDEAHGEAVDGLEVGRRVPGPLRIAFEVGDTDTATRSMAAAGAEVIAEPVRTPWGSVNARLRAPDGQQLTVYANHSALAGRTRLDGPVVLADPDPEWAATAAGLAADVRRALGPTAAVIEHVGSTAVDGLPAKPVIDLVLGVPDSTDEATYVAPLQALGYSLRHREPEWYEHRLLKHTGPDVNLHVFSVGCPEIDRLVAFRDQLRRDATDRDLYLRTKRALAARTWAYVQDYADAKADVVADILRRA